MRKLFLTIASVCLLLASFSQAQRRGEKTNATDTASKGKTSTVPISTMSNTMNVTTNPTVNNAAITVTNENKTTNTQPMTLEELTKKVTNLESQLQHINDKLQFDNMAFVEIVADNSNLSGNTILKIDHPLCNNNPKAKIFFSPSGDISVPILGIYYRQPYWYAAFSTVKATGFQPYYPTEFRVAALSTNMSPDDPMFVLKQMDPAKELANVFLTGAAYHIETGSKFSFLVFKELPDYNPAIYQRPSNQ